MKIENPSCIEFVINGKQHKKNIPPSLLLIDLIREDFGLKGTKPGCNEGECGACTVLIDGKAVNSCLYLAVNIHGKEVTTIEGLSRNNGSTPEPVLEAFVKFGAVQCGFCSPGMIMSIKSFHTKYLESKSVPDREEIKKGMEGNLCRCTGYCKIIDAIESLFPKP